MAPDIGEQQLLIPDYNATLGAMAGVYGERIRKILENNKLFSYNKKNVALPFSAGHFINPFFSKEIRTRKSLKYDAMLSDSVNYDLAYFLRSGKQTVVDVLPDGTKQKKKNRF